MRTKFAFAMFAVVALATICAKADEVDGIVAQVGDTAILRSEVLRRMKPFGLPANEDYDKLLQQIIEEKLILKAAAVAKMTMQEWVVDNRIREITEKSFGGDRNKLIEALAAEKLPYSDFRQRIKEDLIVTAMRWNAIDKYVNPSPAQMRKEYQEHPERYRAPASTSVSVILLREGDDREAVQEALKSEDFATVARRYSADTHAKDGGLWKDIRPEEVFLKEVCDEIARLKPGETSGWIDLSGWSFLVRKESETSATERSFADAYDDIELNCRIQRSDELYRRWVDILKAETYIKVY